MSNFKDFSKKATKDNNSAEPAPEISTQTPDEVKQDEKSPTPHEPQNKS
ncbi:hypothetical protein [Acinetobacter radioresistens]|nr:hypothetical protein [Acinetobacter radioresistens]MCK4102028.1 hypothetical protein [Acinetobacter radioresistens]